MTEKIIIEAPLIDTQTALRVATEYIKSGYCTKDRRGVRNLILYTFGANEELVFYVYHTKRGTIIVKKQS